MGGVLAATAARLGPRKFQDPFVTAKGERRAWGALGSLDTLWVNTGTLCNLTCRHWYIESAPKNDRRVHLSTARIGENLDQIARLPLRTRAVALTGGEP